MAKAISVMVTVSVVLIALTPVAYTAAMLA